MLSGGVRVCLVYRALNPPVKVRMCAVPPLPLGLATPLARRTGRHFNTHATERPGAGHHEGENEARATVRTRAVALSAKRPLRWSRATSNQQHTEADPCRLRWTRGVSFTFACHVLLRM